MTQRRPGEWPVPPATAAAVDDADEREARYLALAAEKARFHITLGALRSALEEQPNEACVRAAGRRWINAAVQAIDEVAKEQRHKQKEGNR